MPAWGLQEGKLGRWEGRRVKSLPAPCQHSPFSRQPSAPSAAAATASNSGCWCLCAPR